MTDENDRLLGAEPQHHYSGDDLPQVDTESFNPFVYDYRLTTYERVKIGLMCLFLIPVWRLVAVLLLFVPLVVLAVLGTFGHVPVDPATGRDVPLSPVRRTILYPMRWIMRAILFVLGFYYIPIKYPRNQQHHSPKARIIVANHVTFIDGIFFVAHCFPSVAMKADLGRIPVIGRVVRALDPILIDRKTASGRRQALQRIHDRPASGEFPDLLIFPEGTTSNQTNLTKFKRGPFTPGLPVQPVVLRYPHRHFDLSWPPTVSSAYLFGRLLCQVSQRLEVEYLPVYTPSEREMRDADVFAENVRAEMARCMEVSCTNHAFEDVVLLMKIGDYAVDQVLPRTTIEEIRALTRMDAAQIERLIQHFAANDTNRDGKISFVEMKAILRTTDSALMHRLFDLMDPDGAGQIDFRDLCLGLSALSPKFTREQMMRFGFALYDPQTTNHISKDHVKNVLIFLGSRKQLSQDNMDQLPDKVSFDQFKRLVE